MPDDALIGALVDDLEPVRPRRRWVDAAVMLGVAAVELGLVLWLYPMGDGMAAAMASPFYAWKVAATLALALAGGVAAVLALDPAAELRPARRALAVLGGFIAAIALLLAGGTMGEGSYLVRLDWREGLECLVGVCVYGLPVTLAFLLRARRAAPVSLRAAALAAGVAGGGWGAFVFAWRCPHVDPLYLLVWYGGAIGLATLLVRWWLPSRLRW